MRGKLLFIILMGTLAVLSGRAQEPQFTQFYAAPLYLNPAYTGADVCYRAATNYRNQWPGIPGAFVSYTFSLDHGIKWLNSGVGLLFTNDKAGSGSLRATSIGLLYSYSFPVTRKVAARIGIKASETIRSINFYDLVFGDQLVRNSSTTVQTPSNDQVMYFDFSGGALVYSSGFWMGVAVDHLSKPNQSLVADGQSMLPLKLSLHTGLKIPLGYVSATRQVFLSPALNYRNQQNFNQLDLGVYFSNDPMIVGLWYRGIPFLKTTESAYVNNDALAVLVGFTADRLRVGYSYDLSVSRLIGSTGGSHELSLSYQFCDYKKLRVKKSRKISSIPCPSF